MDVNDLRAIQAPIKERYKQEPWSALITARAEAVVDDKDIACRVTSSVGKTIVGLHPATGGDGSAACSADMLMVEGRCNGDAHPYRTQQEVIAEGVWDARETLAVDRDAPVGLTDVKLTFEIDAAVESKKLDKLIELTERYCVVYQTLANPLQFITGYQKAAGS